MYLHTHTHTNTHAHICKLKICMEDIWYMEYKCIQYENFFYFHKNFMHS